MQTFIKEGDNNDVFVISGEIYDLLEADNEKIATASSALRSSVCASEKNLWGFFRLTYRLSSQLC